MRECRFVNLAEFEKQMEIHGAVPECLADLELLPVNEEGDLDEEGGWLPVDGGKRRRAVYYEQ